MSVAPMFCDRCGRALAPTEEHRGDNLCATCRADLAEEDRLFDLGADERHDPTRSDEQ